jgi:DNA-binding transcriptional LysR family regulator
MDIKNLRYFVAVVESTSISAAALVLHISQPSLSTQIKLLEEELGVTLLERGARHVTLTDAGKTLYQRAKTLIDYTEITKTELQEIEHGVSGTLRIGMISSCGPMLLPNVFSSFREKYPKIRFNIFERNTYGLLDSMENNFLDLAFVRTPFENAAAYNKACLSREPMIAVGHRQFFAEDPGDILPLVYFDEKPLIIYRRWENILSSIFSSEFIEPVIYCENDDARTCLMWANARFGIAIVPESIAHSMPADDMCYIRIDAPKLTTEIHAIWNERRYMSGALKNFIDNLLLFSID